AGADTDSQVIAGFGAYQRSFQFHRTTLGHSDATSHGAAVLVNRRDGCIENVLESRKLRYRLAARRREDAMRRAFCDDAAAFEHQQVLAKHENFVSTVGHV